MFKLFKKTSWKIESTSFYFFENVFNQLPEEFQFLSTGLQKGLYKSFLVNHAMKGNHFTISFDPSQSDKSMIKGKQFDLENILIKKDGVAHKLNLNIYEGLWAGFEFEKNIAEFAEFQGDLSKFCKINSGVQKNSKITELVRGLKSAKLDLNSFPEIEISGQTYYQIKDLEDGNYLAINSNGQVFGLIHDPFKIELINGSISDFVMQVNNGSFSFHKYLGASL